jgi:hypothetical protein
MKMNKRRLLGRPVTLRTPQRAGTLLPRPLGEPIVPAHGAPHPDRRARER